MSSTFFRERNRFARYANADFLLVLVTLLAAFGWLASYYSLKGLPPLLFIGIRFVLAGLMLGVLGWPELRRMPGAQLVKSCGATGLSFAAGITLWILAVHHAKSMGVGAFITSLGVIFAPLVGWVMFRIHITRATWVALGIATLGMGCLAAEKGLSFALSDVLFVGCAIAFSMQFNLNSRFASRIPVLPLTAVQLTIAGVSALFLSAALESWPASIGVNTLAWLISSILLSSCLRFFLQVKAQGMASVSHAALIMTLEPIWTALIGAAFLGERMTRIQIVGCLLILLALLVNRARWIPRRKP